MLSANEIEDMYIAQMNDIAKFEGLTDSILPIQTYETRCKQPNPYIRFDLAHDLGLFNNVEYRIISSLK